MLVTLKEILEIAEKRNIAEEEREQEKRFA